MLYIVPTPIGNLKDITLRAIETLKQVDTVICEDTRRSSILLNSYQIKKPFLVLNDYNETREVPKIIARLENGENLALISDAGTPLISDPGFRLVREALTAKIEVDSLPGPTASITAMTLSTLPPQHQAFMQYFPEKEKARIDLLNKIKNISSILPFTYIFYVAPHKLITSLTEINQVLGNIEIVLAKELTKLNQSVEKKPAAEWLEYFKDKPPKGEYVLLFHC